jgi:hypothetical protein
LPRVFIVAEWIRWSGTSFDDLGDLQRTYTSFALEHAHENTLLAFRRKFRREDARGVLQKEAIHRQRLPSITVADFGTGRCRTAP